MKSLRHNLRPPPEPGGIDVTSSDVPFAIRGDGAALYSNDLACGNGAYCGSGMIPAIRVTSGHILIADPNDFCDAFNGDGKKERALNSSGITLPQYGCSGSLFSFGSTYKLFNIGHDSDGTVATFDDNAFRAVPASCIYKYESDDTPFSNQIDTDVGYLSFIDFTAAFERQFSNELEDVHVRCLLKVPNGSYSIGYELYKNGGDGLGDLNSLTGLFITPA